MTYRISMYKLVKYKIDETFIMWLTKKANANKGNSKTVK